MYSRGKSTIEPAPGVARRANSEMRSDPAPHRGVLHTAQARNWFCLPSCLKVQAVHAQSAHAGCKLTLYCGASPSSSWRPAGQTTSIRAESSLLTSYCRLSPSQPSVQRCIRPSLCNMNMSMSADIIENKGSLSICGHSNCPAFACNQF